MLPPLSSIFPATKIYFEPQPPLAEGAAAASVETTDYIELPDIRINDFSTLRRDPLFPKIQEQFLADIETLLSLAVEFVGDKYDHHIKTFLQRIRDLPSSVHKSLVPLYQDTRYQIHCMVRMMREHCTATADIAQHDSKRDLMIFVLHHCLPSLSKCNAGIHCKIASAWRQLTTDASLTTTLCTIRQEQLRNYVGHIIHVARRDGLETILIGSEIHWANALFNLAAQELGLDTIMDGLAPAQTALSPPLLERFFSGLPAAVNGHTVHEQFIEMWLEKLAIILDSHPIGDWRKEPIAIENFGPELLNQIKQEISEPLFSLLQERGAKEIGLWSLTIADDNTEDHYDLRRSAEFLHGLLTQGVLAIKPAPLRQLSHTGECLFTLGGLFFWVEPVSLDPQDSLSQQYIPENTVAAELSHLVEVSLNALPEEVQKALLLQAMAQTKDAGTILKSLCSNELGEQLTSVSESITLAIANALALRMEKNKEFASNLLTAATEIDFKKIPEWLFHTPLLETILQTRCDRNQQVTDTVELLLAPRHLPLVAGFSDATLKRLFTPEQCCQLFEAAMDRGMGSLVNRLLGTGNCDACLVTPFGLQVLALLISHGKVEGIKYVLATGQFDPNEADPTQQGKTALHLAAQGPSLECLKLLLNSPGININSRDKTGRTPILLAAKTGNTINLLHLLSVSGIDALCTNNQGSNAIHLAVEEGHKECLVVLLNSSHNINPSILNKSGMDAIRIAVKYSYLECLKTLLAHPGMKVNQRSPSGENIWHIAVKHGRPDILALLLEQPHVPLNVESKGGCAMLHMAAMLGNTEALKLLLLQPQLNVNLAASDGGATAMEVAISQGHTEFVRLLLKDERTVLSRKLLHIAERYGFPEIAKLLAQDERLTTKGLSFRIPSFFSGKP